MSSLAYDTALTSFLAFFVASRIHVHAKALQFAKNITPQLLLFNTYEMA